MDSDPMKASCEELLAAGWGEVNRIDIPLDWRTRRPPVKLKPNQSVEERKAASERGKLVKRRAKYKHVTDYAPTFEKRLYERRLANMGTPGPDKKANWLKFCQKCGADISKTGKGIKLCEPCAQRDVEDQICNLMEQNRKNGAIL
jgi:hypothetical protein